MIMFSSNFIFSFSDFCATLLRLDILFSTAVRVAVAAKLVILDISSLTSFVLALRAAKLVVSGILSSIISILPL